ncbi:MAG: UDP-N-acetylglucosamine--LPS N-acetylglucosamine transferase [Alphaproteobacteria bacterium]
MAIASRGGHWVELRRLRPAWAGCAVSYVTTDGGYLDEVKRDPVDTEAPDPRFFVVTDASRWDRWLLAKQMVMVLLLVLRIRPDVIVTTGAAPGYFAVRFGKLFGARTIWVDSVANAESLSLSGELAGRYCTLWLTQWHHLAGEDRRPGPLYRGAVL